jgi:hypothetical protein
MLRSVWFYVLAAVVVSTAGGWYLYEHQSTQVVMSGEPAASAPMPTPLQDDLQKKRLESIGSIKDLKTVPLDEKP